MVTHTLISTGFNGSTKATKAQFVKLYRDAEKRATVSAGGLAFQAEDRLSLNAMRVSLGYDFTQAADAVTVDAKDYARHWQRFQHWANQIKKGLIRVAPEAAEIADRTHKTARKTKDTAKRSQALTATQSAKEAGQKEPAKPLGTLIIDSALQAANGKGESLHQLGMIFNTREEAEAHLQEVVYGLARLGMDDMDALVPTIQAKLLKAKADLELEAKAQAVVTVLERAGSNTSEATKILELAMSLMPS